MKFVDILARELKVWPEGDSPLVQGSFGQVYICGGGPIIIETCRADDWELGEVTRAEWQAAVDALNADKCEHSYANKIGCPECGELNAPKVVEWDEVGLPPVGLDVEIKRGNCTWIDGDEWQIGKTATVMASFLNSRDIEMASVQFPGGHCECILARCLSPIRTAEQVAAEEREAEDNEIMSRYLSLSDCEKGMLGRSPERVIIGLMRVMGYRKEPKPCGS